MSLYRGYVDRCTKTSDINEHLPTLFRYASECNHITECGVNTAVSSYAFAIGLKGKTPNRLIQCDIKNHPNISTFQSLCVAEGIDTVFYEQSDLDCPMEQTDLLFIDTWHIYGHLKRELARWHSYATKYIIFHDTTVDEWIGESIRERHDQLKESRETGIPLDEIRKGLWPAIAEFIEQHPEWVQVERFTNNNGLTVLKRV